MADRLLAALCTQAGTWSCVAARHYLATWATPTERVDGGVVEPVHDPTLSTVVSRNTVSWRMPLSWQQSPPGCPGRKAVKQQVTHVGDSCFTLHPQRSHAYR